jgi:putative transposase
VLRNRGPFPNEDAVFKVLFLAIQNAKTNWRANKNWNRVLSQLDIFFEGRLPA